MVSGPDTTEILEMGPVRLGWDTLLVLVLPPAQKFAERPTAFLLIYFFEHLLGWDGMGLTSGYWYCLHF